MACISYFSHHLLSTGYPNPAALSSLLLLHAYSQCAATRLHGAASYLPHTPLADSCVTWVPSDSSHAGRQGHPPAPPPPNPCEAQGMVLLPQISCSRISSHLHLAWPQHICMFLGSPSRLIWRASYILLWPRPPAPRGCRHPHHPRPSTTSIHIVGAPPAWACMKYTSWEALQWRTPPSWPHNQPRCSAHFWAWVSWTCDVWFVMVN
jgi:hypothetical protein